jgi:hypothetical protein
MASYENLHNHMKYHGIKRALLDMCDREDANTIREALQSTPSRRIIRYLARALATDKD